MHGIFGSELRVNAIKHILLVAVGVEDGKLRRIEKAPGIQAVQLKEVAVSGAAIADINGAGRLAERPIGAGDVSRGLGEAFARAGRHVDDQAGFVAVLCRRCTRDHVEGLHGVRWDLVGENLALLVGDRLAVERERVRCMVAEAVEKTVRVGSHTGRSKRDE